MPTGDPTSSVSATAHPDTGATLTQGPHLFPAWSQRPLTITLDDWIRESGCITAAPWPRSRWWEGLRLPDEPTPRNRAERRARRSRHGDR